MYVLRITFFVRDKLLNSWIVILLKFCDTFVSTKEIRGVRDGKQTNLLKTVNIASICGWATFSNEGQMQICPVYAKQTP